MFEWSTLVEYFKNYPKFCTVALYLHAMHAVIYVLKYFEILSTKL